MSIRVGERLSEERSDPLVALRQSAREKWGSFEDSFYDRLLWISKGMVSGWSWAAKRHFIIQYGTVVVGLALALIFGRAFLHHEPVQSQLLLFLPAVLLSATYGGGVAAFVTSIVGAIAAYVAWPPQEQSRVVTDTGVWESLPYVPYLLYFMVCLMVIGLWKLQERRQAEVEKIKAQLEDRVDERTSDLRAANEELSSFCYSISHDLRAPMRNIAASSSLLAEELEGKLDESNQELVSAIGRSAGRLSELVDDLLNHARLGNAALKPRWVNLTGMADEVGSMLRKEDWPCRTIEFRVQPNMVVTADPLLLKLALHNLMENACKYSKTGSDLVIEVKESRSRQGAVFAVKDNGIGFENEYANRIFEPFQRLHRDSEYPGTGIGLANVKRIIDRHEGRIWAESKPGVGSTFFFTIGELKKNLVELTETESV
ncbi:MAG TPA: ATP-binding protein [Fimbriimonadaceae bacterium]|nr:ATP-binding protein [Fimbriimonadaceae bacterium]